MQSKQVRVVEEVTSETATTAASSGNVSSVRMVSTAGGAFDSCYVEDLTVFSSGASCSSVQHVQMISEACVHFDMSRTDSDSDWIFSPDASPCALNSVSDFSDSSCSHRSFHVRAVSDTQSSYMTAHCCDVILDSGADTSALPLSFAELETSAKTPVQRLWMRKVFHCQLNQLGLQQYSLEMCVSRRSSSLQMLQVL